ncbi:hypothetical protein PFY12_05650 [Chryseobacterium camelliae]|uniref:Lipoprotein n=1 Tax=Chryseobacterium camelliae TaxID=1265445 RepID=A0ABY7QPM3_9FLAO|nr:hypothetical protein [Chryseobacterium camelliae]WBV61607.1 hypothetical protein PFY12_05650 [Chryseobacterium camelliae]
MKKHLLLSAFIMLGLTSCSNERTAMESVENTQTTEMTNFNKALRSLNEPKNRPTAEERKQNSLELSDSRKELLVPASKDLILSTGITEKEMIHQTGGDKTKIIDWASKIYFEKNRQINRNLKLEN